MREKIYYVTVFCQLFLVAYAIIGFALAYTLSVVSRNIFWAKQEGRIDDRLAENLEGFLDLFTPLLRMGYPELSTIILALFSYSVFVFYRDMLSARILCLVELTFFQFAFAHGFLGSQDSIPNIIFVVFSLCLMFSIYRFIFRPRTRGGTMDIVSFGLPLLFIVLPFILKVLE